MMCMMALHLAVFVAPMISGLPPPYFEEYSEAEVKNLREDFKDAEKLRKHLEIFLVEGDLEIEQVVLFKRKFSVSDEAMQTALINIYRESAKKPWWGKEFVRREDFRLDDNLNYMDDRMRFFGLLSWLGACAEAEGKKLLMDIITDTTIVTRYRTSAIESYLSRADAQEVRDMLVRFLVGDMKQWSDEQRLRGVIYFYACQIYDWPESGARKREAIVASLAVALAKEDDKEIFVYSDSDLARQNKGYAESSQRLAMLERMSQRPPPIREDLLNYALDSFKSRTTFTSVNTNLTELMARDFRKSTP